jgi:hypothetical protein
MKRQAEAEFDFRLKLVSISNISILSSREDRAFLAQ